MHNLPIGTLLQNKYKILKILGSGGFGITYLAIHTLLGKEVAIKEFFPSSLCYRSSLSNDVKILRNEQASLKERLLNKFMKEAKNIAKLNHPNIIKIMDVFKQNGTAYYIMEYIEGIPLNSLIKSYGKLTENKALRYFNQIGIALDYIHCKKMVHLDVKPANIIIRKEDDMAILIDFGLSKQYDYNGDQTSTTPIGLSPGFAPIEQYSCEGVEEFSPQTDEYSLGATLYYMLTGTPPPDAITLLNNKLYVPSFISAKIKEILINCMKSHKNERYLSIKELLLALSDITRSEASKKIYLNQLDLHFYPCGINAKSYLNGNLFSGMAWSKDGRSFCRFFEDGIVKKEEIYHINGKCAIRTFFMNEHHDVDYFYPDGKKHIGDYKIFETKYLDLLKRAEIEIEELIKNAKYDDFPYNEYPYLEPQSYKPSQYESKDITISEMEIGPNNIIFYKGELYSGKCWSQDKRSVCFRYLNGERYMQELFHYNGNIAYIRAMFNGDKVWHLYLTEDNLALPEEDNNSNGFNRLYTGYLNYLSDMVKKELSLCKNI